MMQVNPRSAMTHTSNHPILNSNQHFKIFDRNWYFGSSLLFFQNRASPFPDSLDCHSLSYHLHRHFNSSSSWGKRAERNKFYRTLQRLCWWLEYGCYLSDFDGYFIFWIGRKLCDIFHWFLYKRIRDSSWSNLLNDFLIGLIMHYIASVFHSKTWILCTL